MSAFIIHPVDLGAIKCRDPRRPLSPSSLTTLSPPTEELGRLRDPRRRLANFLLRAFAESLFLEEEAVRNRAHTKMTSNMIKASLKDMRDKLSKMKHNKEVMAVGMKKLDGEFLNTKTALD